MQHAAGAQEQQALEHGVVHHVVQAGQQADGGQPRQPGGPAHDTRAHAQQDNADILYRVVGQQTLQIVLAQGVHHAHHRRHRADDYHQHTPAYLTAGYAQQVEAYLANAEDADLDHATGHERTHIGRRGRMGLGQPGMKGHHAGLRAEAEEGQHERHRSQTRRKGRGAECLELQGAGGAGHNEERDGDHQKTDMGHDEVQKAAAQRLLGDRKSTRLNSSH